MQKHWCVPTNIFTWQDHSRTVSSFFTYGLTSSGKYASSCQNNMVYSNNITSNSHTCRCLGTTDLSCHATFPPIDGCICTKGTYLDDSGNCVPSKACPCYDKGSVVPPGQVVNKDGVMWYENYILFKFFIVLFERMNE